MRTLYKNLNMLYKNKTESLEFIVEDQRFVEIGKNLTAELTVDLKNMLVCPGLFDIHTHGAMGYDFNMATLDEMKIIMDYYLKNGVTSVLPTIMTDDVKVIHCQLKRIAELKEIYPSIHGIHLEGPHLAMKYKGAMPESYILKPDLDLFKSFIEDSNHLIRLTTIAPELENALELIKYAKKNNIQVTLGHSDATFDETYQAIHEGAGSFTHLFNAMRPLNHHEPGILGAALTSKNYTEMIMDGMHLNKNTVMMLKNIRPYNKLIIVTDSIMATG
ncbi:MAG: amidohydrolase family protein, partial [Acholeplasmataceae bacterium]|nr:amidohydrolase family protein [Acholeplasmataceae bacterium]